MAGRFCPSQSSLVVVLVAAVVVVVTTFEFDASCDVRREREWNPWAATAWIWIDMVACGGGGRGGDIGRSVACHGERLLFFRAKRGAFSHSSLSVSFSRKRRRASSPCGSRAAGQWFPPESQRQRKKRRQTSPRAEERLERQRHFGSEWHFGTQREQSKAAGPGDNKRQQRGKPGDNNNNSDDNRTPGDKWLQDPGEDFAACAMA